MVAGDGREYEAMNLVEGAVRRRIRLGLAALISVVGLAAPSTIVRAEETRASVAGPAEEAVQDAWIARVAATGLVRVSGAEIAARGAPTQFSRLCLRWRGQVLSMHVVDADGDGTIDVDDEIRFYAPGGGDRYNATDTYWFSDDPTCHRSMAERSAGLLGGSPRVTVRQRGVWRNPSAYWEPQGGPDGDHWFSAYLASDLESGETWSIDASAPGDLPATFGSATYTVTGVARMNREHAARMVGNGWNTTARWSGAGNFTAAVRFDTMAAPTGFAMQPGAIDAVLVDAVYWDRAALLAPGGEGARFVAAANGDHSVTGASESLVYDVSAPLTPTAITLSSDKFAATAGREYLIPGSAVLTTATLDAYSLQQGEDLRTARNAAAVYIAPRAWLNALEPLLARRRITAGSATAVPAEAIYAQFGHGQSTPQAIRNFLRYAYATWPVRPKGVVLIGDASYDVRDYSGNGFTTILPPFLADVDRYNGEAGKLGEAACEACFALLDGDDPLTDDVPELIYGRIPVQTSAQLTAYVAKVIAYETATTDDVAGSWRTYLAYLVDDTVRPDGTIDSAGDFWRTAENSIAEQNFYSGIRRLYYDPTGALGPVTYAVGQPTNASNPANERTRALFETGAAFITYIGHASQNRIGDLGRPQSGIRNYLLNQNEVETLPNAARLPIMLQMTCLTGAYTYGYVDANQRVTTAFDERTVLAAGGAVAAWGSTGLGVAYGHDILLSGFFAALWRPGGRSLTLGELAQAGYAHLYDEPRAPFAQDLIRTFLITGDAFLQPRIYAPRVLLPSETVRVYVPQAIR
jgi:hypothetical protein